MSHMFSSSPFSTRGSPTGADAHPLLVWSGQTAWEVCRWGGQVKRVCEVGGWKVLCGQNMHPDSNAWKRKEAWWQDRTWQAVAGSSAVQHGEVSAAVASWSEGSLMVFNYVIAHLLCRLPCCITLFLALLSYVTQTNNASADAAVTAAAAAISAVLKDGLVGGPSGPCVVHELQQRQRQLTGNRRG